jgi:alpha-amylase
MMRSMFADVDHSHPDVRRDLFFWAEWLGAQLPRLGGLRLDAIKHFSSEFLRDFVAHIDSGAVAGGRNWFMVGEYWREESAYLADYIDFMGRRISLFDVQLVANFSKLSLQEGSDLRTVFEDTLVGMRPENAVVSCEALGFESPSTSSRVFWKLTVVDEQSFVVNHDTVSRTPLHALCCSDDTKTLVTHSLARRPISRSNFSRCFHNLVPPLLTPHQKPVTPYFLPLAYALILLRANAGLPCVFYSDLYGSLRKDHTTPSTATVTPPLAGGRLLPRLMLARKLWAYGTQVDYIADSADPSCIGFTRFGHPSRSGGAGIAAIMTNAWEYARKRMKVGRRHAGERWTDVLRGCPGVVVIDADGCGDFVVGPRMVAVWANEKAVGRERVDGVVL